MQFRKHKCISCGYLCYRVTGQDFIKQQNPWLQSQVTKNETISELIEIAAIERESYSIEIDKSKTLFCYRREISFERELIAFMASHGRRGVSEIITKVNIPRKCRYFMKHLSGYTPSQHLERWELVDHEKSNRYWNLFYLLLGAALTLLGSVLFALLTRNE